VKGDWLRRCLSPLYLSGSAGACPPVSSGRLKQRRERKVTLWLVDPLGLACFFHQAATAAAAEKTFLDDDCDKNDHKKEKDYSEKREHAVLTPSLLPASVVVR
jgi:hypothetical protein